ncbi:VirK/YbjX family protein [Paraburkholderia sp. A1RO-5L]|uniref:VirK/YbjX family protein n=1 Tax=unclassified Paraburkholderia TaxID=2615204 RepID=UPI003B7C3635
MENWSWLTMSISEIYKLLSKSIPGRTPHDLFRRGRVLMYALLNPSAARIWLKALTTTPLLADIAVRNRRFLERPFHCFAQADMPAYQRAELLCGHFRVARELFGEGLVRRLHLNSEYVTLASSERYALVVSEPVRCWREGLLTVAWRDVLENVDLAWATISFERHAKSRNRGVLIGGLQGPAGADRERVREATRACYGLRPKAAVMEAIGEFCRLARVDVLAGVTKKTHVSAATDVQFSADYDGFWRELGGVEVDGRFVLPLRPYHRDISEVPSKRRAEFRRRQTLIAELLEQIDRAVHEGLTADVVSPHPSRANADDHLPELAVALAANYVDPEPA